MFGLVHLDFTLILWPYYVTVAALYGTITYLTQSILPAIALHTAGNLYSNFDLWRHGQSEWQTAERPDDLVWQTGVDQSFLVAGAAVAGLCVATLFSYHRLAQAAKSRTV